MNRELKLQENELMENPSIRFPVCLCLDISGSMNCQINGVSKIDALNEGIQKFYNDIKKSEISMYSADIEIITFNSHAQVYDPFSTVEKKVIPFLEAEGGSALGEALSLSLTTLLDQKRRYKEYGIDYYQPWLVILTDGVAGDPQKVDEIIPIIRKLEVQKKLTVMPIGIGTDVDFKTLNRLSCKKAIRLNSFRFTDMFEFMSMSIDNSINSKVSKNISKKNAIWNKI